MSGLIDREMMLPDILRQYPSCRKVFDRYGLLGCGGPYGPQESLAFFSRAHQVDEERLLAELEDAARGDSIRPARLEYKPGPADVIYRKFFKAGILSIFTFGCVLGGAILAVMASRGTLAALDLRAVIWAHAHAQIAGWVTFFVMGFAYQAVPRFKFTTLPAPRLATATLYVMGGALIVRIVAELFPGSQSWRAFGVAAGTVELGIVITFAAIIGLTIRRSQRASEPYDKFLITALAWMIAGFAFDLWVFLASGAIVGEKNWIRFISLYDAPWRDIQLLGFAGGMILGVSQRYLPFICGFREVRPGTSRLVYFLWNLSLVANIFCYSLLVRTEWAVWGVLLEASIAGLLAAVLLLVRALGLYSVRVEPDRSVPFLRAAYAWATAALAILLALPAYDALMGTPFSHAFFSAYRHAFTVGFISMMIVGVAGKVVPTLGGLDVRTLSTLVVPFWLLNIGCAMRVAFQVLADSQPWAFPWMAASAWIEVSGLAWWAIDLWRAMGRQPSEREAPAVVEVAPGTRVYDIVERYPESIPVFLEFGFSMITSPIARNVFARSVSLEQACRLKNVRYEDFAAALRSRLLTCTGVAAPDSGLVQLEPGKQDPATLHPKIGTSM